MNSLFGSTVEFRSTVEHYSGVTMEKKISFMKSINKFAPDDNLSRLIDKYEIGELDMEELDRVYAATKNPDYEAFMRVVLDKE